MGVLYDSGTYLRKKQIFSFLQVRRHGDVWHGVLFSTVIGEKKNVFYSWRVSSSVYHLAYMM